jgi:hypothetical protein
VSSECSTLEIPRVIGAMDAVLACSDARAIEAALAAHLQLEEPGAALAERRDQRPGP